MQSDSVTAQTARKVSATYEQLWNLRPPQAAQDQRAATDAARAFAAERAELDEIAVERALAGDGVHLEHLTPAEQHEVVRRLTERGKSIRDIAQQLATTNRTISRRRASINAA
jgi:DNA-binding NarL/FixJ family response regulator